MAVIAPVEGFIEFTTDPFPPGINVFASISLNLVDTLFSRDIPDPTFVIAASIDSWTFYQDDGSESPPQSGTGFNQNSVVVDNCARIKFILFGEQVAADAQISIFSF